MEATPWDLECGSCSYLVVGITIVGPWEIYEGVVDVVGPGRTKDCFESDKFGQKPISCVIGPVKAVISCEIAVVGELLDAIETCTR